jgi:hypothetical protein
MANASDYLEDQLVTHIFRTGTFTKPTVLAVALLTTLADDDDTGQFTTSTGVEVTSAGAYAREARNPLDANWTATSGGDGQTDNAAAITFAMATANWGTIVGIGITDNATHDAGNLLFHAAVTASKAINTSDTAEFAIGAITVTFA